MFSLNWKFVKVLNSTTSNFLQTDLGLRGDIGRTQLVREHTHLHTLNDITVVGPYVHDSIAASFGAYFECKTLREALPRDCMELFWKRYMRLPGQLCKVVSERCSKQSNRCLHTRTHNGFIIAVTSKGVTFPVMQSAKYATERATEAPTRPGIASKTVGKNVPDNCNTKHRQEGANK